MNERIIHTKLYSKIAKEVLQSVEGQMSDGMWENSPAMEKYWRFSDIETASDGEILIKISAESGKYDKYARKWLSNGFANMSDAEVIKWFAAKVKHIMQTELKDEDIKNGWKRDNATFETQYLSYKETITVRDVYYIYDFLLGRDVTKKYVGDMGLKIVSAPKSDKETKKEEARRANIAKLQAEWTAERKTLEDRRASRIKEIEAEFKKAVESCNAFYIKLCDNLKD